MDLILVNGNIKTMDDRKSCVQAVAVDKGIIKEVGENDKILKLKDDCTQVIDLKGKCVVPGFNDSHMHLLMYSYNLQNINLVGTKSIDDIVKKSKKFIEQRKISKGKWVLGTGWNQDYFEKGEKVFPTKYDLDKISTEHPIAFIRACYHIVVVNSKALEIAGIDKNTPQIEGGKFVLDENGEPLGIFREKAQSLINNCISEPTVEEIKRMLLEGMKNASKCGITSIQTDDFEAVPGKNYENIIKAYKELKNENKIQVRIYEQCLLPSMKRLSGFLDKGYRTGNGDEFFKIGPLKLLGDGSLGARTAALVEPYNDLPSTRGISPFTQSQLDELVYTAHLNGMQIAIHCIGDRAMYMSFESIEKALNKKNKQDHRHGIVHCQITDKYLLNKFKELNALAYIQPIFLDYDWHIVKDRIGKDKVDTTYNWKTLKESGVHVSCGSDAPVESFDVLNGIYEAVTRKDLKGNPKGGWMPEQKLTVEQALYSFTVEGAYASFEEKLKGSIEKGKLADMVVLSEDIFRIPEDNIKDIKVLMTLFNGKVVYKG